MEKNIKEWKLRAECIRTWVNSSVFGNVEVTDIVEKHQKVEKMEGMEVAPCGIVFTFTHDGNTYVVKANKWMIHRLSKDTDSLEAGTGDYYSLLFNINGYVFDVTIFYNDNVVIDVIESLNIEVTPFADFEQGCEGELLPIKDLVSFGEFYDWD